MERTYINDVRDNLEKTITLCGFVENFRNSRSMAFIVLKDITGKVQVTVEKESHPELVATLDTITLDSVISDGRRARLRVCEAERSGGHSGVHRGAVRGRAAADCA